MGQTGELRTPFFVLAVVLFAFVVVLEVGSTRLAGGGGAGPALVLQARTDFDVEVPPDSDVEEPPGRAISYLALIDGIILYTLGLMALSLVAPQRLQGRVQGVVTLIGSIVLIIVALILAIIAFIELTIMVSLFFAPPFGTIAYLALWGFFPRGDAAALLSVLMFLKLATIGCLLLAQQRFLQNKGLVLLLLTSLVANVVAVFLHGIVPVVLVSITDSIAAIVFAIVAIIWGLVLLIGSIPAIIKALRSTVSVARDA